MCRSERGFTLVELVLTLILIGILAMTVLPRMADPSIFEARGYHDRLVSAARHAQKLAIANGCRTRLTVDAGGHQVMRDACTVDVTSTCDATGAAWIAVQEPGGSAGLISGPRPAGVNVVAEQQHLVFCPNGKTDGGDERTRYQIGGGSFSATFEVVRGTGYVDASL